MNRTKTTPLTGSDLERARLTHQLLLETPLIAQVGNKVEQHLGLMHSEQNITALLKWHQNFSNALWHVTDNVRMVADYSREGTADREEYAQAAMRAWNVLGAQLELLRKKFPNVAKVLPSQGEFKAAGADTLNRLFTALDKDPVPRDIRNDIEAERYVTLGIWHMPSRPKLQNGPSKKVVAEPVVAVALIPANDQTPVGKLLASLQDLPGRVTGTTWFAALQVATYEHAAKLTAIGDQARSERLIDSFNAVNSALQSYADKLLQPQCRTVQAPIAFKNLTDAYEALRFKLHPHYSDRLITPEELRALSGPMEQLAQPFLSDSWRQLIGQRSKNNSMRGH